MKTYLEAYDMCRRYLTDYQTAISPELFNKLMGWVRSRDLAHLAAATSLIDDSTSYSVADTRALLQVSGFFKKNQSLDGGFDTKAEALKSFEGAELSCKLANERLSDLFLHPDFNPMMWKVFERARHVCEDILGPFKAFLELLPSMVTVTSGATSSYKRSDCHPHLKVGRRIACTSTVKPLLSILAREYGFRSIRTVTLNSSRIAFVPKNWKTMRTIACEPDGNLPFQLAFDTYAKGRLRRRNQDLSDQSRNAKLARIGSIDGSLATLDLSAASDTLCRSLVAWLLPWEWYNYLDRVRSPQYKLNNQRFVFEKFSSMGNGATFTVETLIFYSLCVAVGSKRASVYGDDIIVETELAETLCDVLTYAGMSLNREKSYTSGQFRESCGAHWCGGIPVTPYYFPSNGSSKAELCMMVNYLVDLGYPGSKLWELARQTVESASLPLVPINDNPTSGVWITPNVAYKKRMFRHSSRRETQITRYKSYVVASKTRTLEKATTLLLWHIRKNYRKYGERESGVTETSLVPLETFKYVRKWVPYIPVRERREPISLTAWSEHYLSS